MMTATMTRRVTAVGGTLKNKALVLAEKSTRVLEGGKVVLCFRPDESHDRFVTWLVDSGGTAYLGHYFVTIDEALANFHSR